MRGAWRLAVAIWTAGLLLPVPFAASAQDAPAAATNAPASDAIGPPQLQNFSLPGTVVRPAEQPPQPAATASKQAARDEQPQPAAPRVREAAKAPPIEKARAVARAPQPERRPQVASSAAAPSNAPELPALDRPTPASAPVTFRAGSNLPSAPVAPERGLPLWPWLIAAAAAAAGALLLLRRNGHRPVLAGTPHQDEFIAPQPASPPRPPRPAPAPPVVRLAEQPPARSLGVVSTGLRPWVEFGVQPLRCIVGDDRVTIEFELELFNSGSAPARDVLVEAVVINAGPTQEQEIAAFFEQPVGQGERIEAIAPLKRMAFTTQVATAREHVRTIEIGGREVFVPLIAFNVLYRWGSKHGQTSAAYLLGRDGKGDKLAPFRLDLGARLFRGLGARPLPANVRK